MKLNTKTGKVKPVSELFMKITMEEIKLINEMGGRFKMMSQEYWHDCIKNIEEEFALNIVESAFGLSSYKYGPWCMMLDLMELYFIQNVIPDFFKVCNLNFVDMNQIIDGIGPTLANLFKICLYLKDISNPNLHDVFGFKSPEDCPYKAHMTTLVNEPVEKSKELELSFYLCQLALDEGRSPNFPTYDEVYPEGWANCQVRQIKINLTQWLTLSFIKI